MTGSSRACSSVRSLPERHEEQGDIDGASHGNIARWVALIQAEYTEMPGLQLTKRQVQRLWGLDEVTCDASLRALEHRRFLRRTPANVYVRHEESY